MTATVLPDEIWTRLNWDWQQFVLECGFTREKRKLQPAIKDEFGDYE